MNNFILFNWIITKLKNKLSDMKYLFQIQPSKKIVLKNYFSRLIKSNQWKKKENDFLIQQKKKFNCYEIN